MGWDEIDRVGRCRVLVDNEPPMDPWTTMNIRDFRVEEPCLHYPRCLLCTAVILRNILLTRVSFFSFTGQEQATHEIQKGKP